MTMIVIMTMMTMMFMMIMFNSTIKEQIEILKAKDFLDEYWHDDYHDDKELNIKIFRTKGQLYLLHIL